MWTPWMDGTYRCKSLPKVLCDVEGENVTLKGFGILESGERCKGTWKYGDTGEANEAVAEATGKKIYNVDMRLYQGWFDGKGVVSEDGKKITFWSGIGNQLDAYELMTQEELEDFYNNRDPVEVPPNHYKIQPENQGKFLFITGAPGLGKSTTALLLSKMAGYVYYEADCSFLLGSNPYLPPDTKEPFLDMQKQRSLKGRPKESEVIIAEGVQQFMEVLEGRKYDEKKLEGYFREMCADICKERRRMGGDWVVAFAVPTRHFRDKMKKLLGPEVIFVVLNMSEEDQAERVKKRHGGESGDERVKKRHGGESGDVAELMAKAKKLYEPATEDEEQAIDVVVSVNMTREDVVKKVLSMI